MRFLIITLLFLTASCASNNKKTRDELVKEKAEIYYNYGTQNIIAKKYSQALKNLLEAYAYNKKDSRIQNHLGMAYFFKKRPQIAIKFIKLSLQTNPKNTDARMNLATVYVHLEQYREAKIQYDIILDDLTYEKQFQTYYNLGILSLKKSKVREATNYFKQSVNENSAYCPAHFRLGNIYFEQNQFKESLVAFKKAGSGTCYDRPLPHYHQALTLIKLKEYSIAKTKLEEVVERFSLTKYERMANKTLQSLNRTMRKREQNPKIFSDVNGNIFTPDF